jgi:hypothetical protein
MGGLTDRLLWRIYWFLFEWNLNAVKLKAVIIGAMIWIADSLFFTRLISSIGFGIFLGFIVLATSSRVFRPLSEQLTKISKPIKAR